MQQSDDIHICHDSYFNVIKGSHTVTAVIWQIGSWKYPLWTKYFQLILNPPDNSEMSQWAPQSGMIPCRSTGTFRCRQDASCELWSVQTSASHFHQSELHCLVECFWYNVYTLPPWQRFYHPKEETSYSNSVKSDHFHLTQVNNPEDKY